MSKSVAAIGSGVTARTSLPMSPKRLRLPHRKILARAVIAVFALTPAWTAAAPAVAAAPVSAAAPKAAGACSLRARRLRRGPEEER